MANETMMEKDMQKVTAKQRVIRIISLVLVYAFLILMALIVLFPFYWMLNSSLKSLEEYRWSIPSLFPHKLRFVNYVTAFKAESLSVYSIYKSSWE